MCNFFCDNMFKTRIPNDTYKQYTTTPGISLKDNNVTKNQIFF